MAKMPPMKSPPAMGMGMGMKGMMPPGKPGPKPIPGAAAAARGKRRATKPVGAKASAKLPPFMR